MHFSSARALRPASPSSCSSSPEAADAVPIPALAVPRASDSAATQQQALGQRPGKVTAPREGRAMGMLALEIRLSVKYRSSWTCCLRDTFTPLPDI